MGIDRSTYSYYELGKIVPDVKTILSLSKIFGVNYTEILEPESRTQLSDFSSDIKSTGNSAKNDILDFKNITSEERNLLIAFRMLSETSKYETLKFMNDKLKKKKHTSN